ncbi:hypothetical protein DFA_03903 [Cavenderia fasciculata]|uniref:Uncharacterized protein n=1 Tax=Cavenderia fasciculata TaxID=261658 RepID=F4Q0Q8_CACFS|nr:uncharacterized protein DFA_03903 [Cavenderia fasciculata]EGG18409.1 hypothetical protein DFA_03903 [Cavenderia fasciculata]|eukprot:XP_004366313.1 hypothetical protein DFA_03903 [Cavenderia fasciculata]
MNQTQLVLLLAIVAYFSTTVTLLDAYLLEEEIEVYYVEAPLLKSQFGDLLANINAFHSGVLFYTLTTEEYYTVDFIAYPGILPTFFPTIYNDTANNFIDIIWNSSGLVQFVPSYNQTYWTKSNLTMTITGAIFEQYSCWVPYYNETYNYYNLFDVKDEQSNQLYIPSSICNDFVWQSFQTLYDLGGEVVTTVDPPRDFATLFVDAEPIFVEYPQEPDNWAQITNFYINLVGLSHNQTADELLEHIITLFNGQFFLYIGGNYYNMSLSAAPLFEYVPAALPSGERHSENVRYAINCLPSETSQDGGIGGGWIFIIILVCGATAYLLTGSLFNFLNNGKRGTDCIPNKDSWSHFGELVQDGIKFIKGKIAYTAISTSYSSIE